LVFPFMEHQHEKSIIFDILNFIFDSKEKEDGQDPTCDWCNGQCGEDEEVGTGEYDEDDDDKEIMEEEWVDCEECNGMGTQEEEYIDFLNWFESTPSRMRSFDRLASASVRMVLDAEQKGTLTKLEKDAK